MPTLLFRLEGPLQAWGLVPTLEERYTALFPTKSGVVGLLAAALGLPREADISHLARLPLGIRVDREGTLLVDFQMAREVISADGTALRSRVTRRHYLADAAFLAGVEGERGLLEELQEALRNPARILYLGRKSCLPSPPVYLPDGLLDLSLREALTAYPLFYPREEPIRLILETQPPRGFPVPDQPVGTLAERRFTLRHVEEVLWSPST